MRILYFSDIHCEIRAFETRIPWTDVYPLDLGPCLTPWVGQADLVILSGDVATARPERGVDTLRYAQQVSEFLGCPVVVVPGNHEYYGGVFEEDREALLGAGIEGVTVLDRGARTFEKDGTAVRILGATLWTDYRCNGDQHLSMLEARAAMNDHRRIRMHDGRLFLPQDALEEHLASRAWLAAQLDIPHDGPTVIVTHHVPHSAGRNPAYGMNRLSGAFYSDCDDLVNKAIEKKASAFIFGHHHYSLDIELGGLRLLSAQAGYPRENTGWTGPGLLVV